jgi:hypothetical protein
MELLDSHYGGRLTVKRALDGLVTSLASFFRRLRISFGQNVIVTHNSYGDDHQEEWGLRYLIAVVSNQRVLKQHHPPKAGIWT